MRIFVDADACPVVRQTEEVAKKYSVPVTLLCDTNHILQSDYSEVRVINTCNRSEDYVGYSTKFGDSAGDVAPLASYTVTEVLAIGDILDLPKNLVHKAPSDGLCGKTDEDNLGFTYAVLDKYIMTGECEDETVKANIDRRHEMNKHKLELLPVVER